MDDDGRDYNWHMWDWQRELIRRQAEQARLDMIASEARLARNWEATRQLFRVEYLLLGIALLLISRIGT
jgi:hypothetical protein